MSTHHFMVNRAFKNKQQLSARRNICTGTQNICVYMKELSECVYIIIESTTA